MYNIYYTSAWSGNKTVADTCNTEEVAKAMVASFCMSYPHIRFWIERV